MRRGDKLRQGAQRRNRRQRPIERHRDRGLEQRQIARGCGRRQGSVDRDRIACDRDDPAVETDREGRRYCAGGEIGDQWRMCERGDDGAAQLQLHRYETAEA